MLYHLNDLTLNTCTRTVYREQESIRLPELSFDVFVRLIENAPLPVDPDTLCKDVWQANHVSNETIAQRITLIRKALGDNPRSPSYIRTVRGVGYCVIGEVVKAEEFPVSNHLSQPEQQPTAARMANRLDFVFTKAALALFGIAILSVFLLLYEAQIQPSAPSLSNAKAETQLLIERARQQLRLHQAAETRRAIDMLHQALTQDPTSFAARLSLSFALSTNATKFGGPSGEKHQAEALARTLIAEQPNSTNAWSALGYALGAQGKVSESLSAYQYAYQLSPNNAPAMSSAAFVQMERGELFEALSLEVQAKQNGGNSRYAEIQIALSLELLDHPAAKEWQAKALALNPGQIVVTSEIARSYIRNSDPTSALSVLSTLKGADLTAPQASQLRGRAQLMLGDMQGASESFRLAGDGAFFETIAIDVLLGNSQKADALMASKKYQELQTSASPQEWIQLAEVHAAMGQNDRALALITQGVNLGWRDIKWLNVSPFLASLMSSKASAPIIQRTSRELAAQRRLVNGSDRISSFLNDDFS